MQEQNTSYFEAYIGPFCKKDCIFCNEGGFGKRKFLALHDFKKIIENGNFEKVVLSGGEPLLNKDVLEYIKVCSSKSISVSMVTAVVSNLSEDFIKNLMQSGLNELMISLEGPEKIHDALVQETGAYKNIIHFLYKLQPYIGESKTRIIIHSNINAVNYNFLPKFMHHILEKFPFIFTYHLQMLEPQGSAYKNRKILFKKYSTLIQPFIEQIDTVFQHEKIKIGRLPYCIIPQRLHRYISPTPDIYEDNDGEMQEGGYAGTKYESDICKNCKVNTKCDKFFHYYIDMYGNSELHAL